MHLIINFKNEFNEKIYQLFKKNYSNNVEFSPEYQYNCIKSLDYWFILFDDSDNIVASCSVIQENDNIYEINDVLVEPPFRGNNYSTLLIMNVLHYFDQHFDNKIVIKIISELYNYPAYISYKKIFGDPYCIDCKYAYFSYDM